MIDATVTIVNFNTRAKLADCLQSIRQTCQGLALEIIVVDNGSTDGSVEMVRQTFPEVVLVEAGENLGFGRAHNRAMLMGTGRHFIVLNPDTDRGAEYIPAADRFHGRNARCWRLRSYCQRRDGALAHSGHKDIRVLSVAANAFNVRAILPRDEVLRRHFGRWLGKVHSAYHHTMRCGNRGLGRRRLSGRSTRGLGADWRVRRADFPERRGLRLVLPNATAGLADLSRARRQPGAPDAPEQGAGLHSELRRPLSLRYCICSGSTTAIRVLAVKAILLVAFACRYLMATVENMILLIARRPPRETEAYRAVIEEAVRYRPPPTS